MLHLTTKSIRKKQNNIPPNIPTCTNDMIATCFIGCTSTIFSIISLLGDKFATCNNFSSFTLFVVFLVFSSTLYAWAFVSLYYDSLKKLVVILRSFFEYCGKTVSIERYFDTFGNHTILTLPINRSIFANECAGNGKLLEIKNSVATSVVLLLVRGAIYQSTKQCMKK